MASRFVTPVPILQGSTLVSSSASTASDPAAYVPGTTYASGAQVTYGTIIYQSLVPSNTGNTPGVSPASWQRIGSVNQMAMFDAQVSTQTLNTDSIVVTLAPGAVFDTLSLQGLDASGVSVSQTDPNDGLVYTETKDLVQPVSALYPYYSYFFDRIKRSSKALFTGFRPYPASTVTVTISKTGNTARCGLLVIGKSTVLRAVSQGAVDSITDYSVVQTDAFGVRDIVKRDYADDADFQVAVNVSDSPMFRDTLAAARATPQLVVPADDTRPDIQFYGLLSFRRTLSFPTVDFYAITVKGYT